MKIAKFLCNNLIKTNYKSYFQKVTQKGCANDMEMKEVLNKGIYKGILE